MVSVSDDGSCTYSQEISISIDDGEYTVMVLARNDVGRSTGNPSVDIGMLYYFPL